MDEDDSGLTFEEWDPSVDTDVSEAPVTMIVNSSQLCGTGFDLREVIPLQLETVTRGADVCVARTSSRFTAWVPGGCNDHLVLRIITGGYTSIAYVDTDHYCFFSLSVLMVYTCFTRALSLRSSYFTAALLVLPLALLLLYSCLTVFVHIRLLYS